MTLLRVMGFETELITKAVSSTLGAGASAAKSILSSQAQNRRPEMQSGFGSQPGIHYQQGEHHWRGNNRKQFTDAPRGQSENGRGPH